MTIFHFFLLFVFQIIVTLAKADNTLRTHLHALRTTSAADNGFNKITSFKYEVYELFTI